MLSYKYEDDRTGTGNDFRSGRRSSQASAGGRRSHPQHGGTTMKTKSNPKTIEDLASSLVSDPDALSAALYGLLSDAHGWGRARAQEEIKRAPESTVDAILAMIMED